jgi:hypothetical protein
LAPLLVEGGHDVETVLSEGLSGRSDEVVYQVCLQEARTRSYARAVTGRGRPPREQIRRSDG